MKPHGEQELRSHGPGIFSGGNEPCRYSRENTEQTKKDETDEMSGVFSFVSFSFVCFVFSPGEPMTTFLLIRHANTDYVGRVVAGWLPGAHLNGEGRRQAEELADRLASAAIDALYSSPLERALETAAPLAARLGLTVQPCEDAGEVRAGEWTGRTFQELAEVPQWRRYNMLRSLTRIPGGELMLEIQTRVVVALERLCERHPHETVAVISHADVIRAAIAHYAGIPLDFFHRIEIGRASVSVVEIGDDAPRILCLNHSGQLPFGLGTAK
jgi:probable phosphomutase (TIGR03848 family)